MTGIQETAAATRDAGSPCNVAHRLVRIAERMPDYVAVATPGRGDVAGNNSYATCTFGALERDSSALARGLVELGVQPGTRLVLLVRPGVEFVKLVFASLKSGATTILIDPGMGRRHLIDCLAAADPEGFIAISSAQAARVVYRKRFPRARFNVTVGRRWFWGGTTYRKLLETGRRSSVALPQTLAKDPAAIIFTSGSTGPPKGVLYTHEMFDTQAMDIQSRYAIEPGGTDLACFPLFGLFNSVMGVTTVFPRMDFSRPATADSEKLLTAAHDWRVTQAFASPAVWNKLSRHCEATGERILTLRKVFSCGAPVPPEVLKRTLACVDPGAEMHTPYGATESLPVSTIAASEVLYETAEQTRVGAGVCVGRRFDSVEWRVVRITDEPIPEIEQAEELPHGEIGELIVRGPQVSEAYITGDPFEHNRLAKIHDGDTVWHRLGDVGYFDDQERFWYCGRKAHRVQTAEGTMFTIPCEAIFNAHPNIFRSALVGIGPPGKAVPTMVLEPEPSLLEQYGKNWGRESYRSLVEELLQAASLHETTRNIRRVLFHPSLPVDVRHNSKINREVLAEWAAEELSGN